MLARLHIRPRRAARSPVGNTYLLAASNRPASSLHSKKGSLQTSLIRSSIHIPLRRQRRHHRPLRSLTLLKQLSRVSRAHLTQTPRQARSTDRRHNHVNLNNQRMNISLDLRVKTRPKGNPRLSPIHFLIRTSPRTRISQISIRNTLNVSSHQNRRRRTTKYTRNLMLTRRLHQRPNGSATSLSHNNPKTSHNRNHKKTSLNRSINRQHRHRTRLLSVHPSPLKSTRSSHPVILRQHIRTHSLTRQRSHPIHNTPRLPRSSINFLHNHLQPKARRTRPNNSHRIPISSNHRHAQRPRLAA